MTNSTKLLLALFILVLSTTQSLAQIDVVPAGGASFTPEELISNVFLGDGVTVTDIQYSGVDGQVGYFSNATGDIGLEYGILLTTGSADGVSAPASDFLSDIGLENSNDSDLDQLANASLNDVAVYDITFIPVSDTLRFRYVFASEEYPEWACSDFNDIFGFFISGPGINGAFSNNAKNIALIPDPADPTGYTFTSDYVAINNISDNNSCPPNYQMYYNDNSSSLNLVYDGYTNVFTAQAIVTPCETYHIKIAIADAGDSAYDSGVFLEAKSFGTGSVITDLQTVSVDGTIVEGCSNAILKFKTPNTLDTDLPLTYDILGNAIFPADYTIADESGASFTPGDPLIIPAGSTEVILEITALEDGIVENGEVIGISVQKDVCTTDTLYIPIKDNVLVNPDLGPDVSICNTNGGTLVQLNGDLGLPEPDAPKFTYTGNDLISNDLPPVNAGINVFGVQPPEIAEGVIRSVCVKIDHKWDADLDIFLFPPNNTPLLLSSDNGNNSRDMEMCFSPTAPANVTTFLDTLKMLFPPNGQVPFGSINNLYFTGNYLPEGNFSDFWAGGLETPTNGQWRLLVYDDQGSQWGDQAEGHLLEWSITFEPLFKLTYEWDQTNDLSCLDCPDPMLTTPTQTTTYTLTVSDTYGCSVTDEITYFVQDSLEAPVIDCGLVGMDFVTFDWSAVIGATSYEINIDGAGWQDIGDILTYSVNGLALGQTVSIQIRGVGECPAKIGIHECTTLECIQPTFTTIITDVNCNGSSDGAIELSNVTGPDGPFTFELGGTTNSTGIFGGLPAGDYQIIIHNDIGCQFPFDTTIVEPTELIATAAETQMVDCFGDATGTGQITVVGGSWPYSFDVNSGTDSIVTALSAGAYPYIVTDDNGCTAAGDLVITENAEISFETQIVDPTCFGETNGQITIFNITGGQADYTFAWDDDQNQTTIAATGLSANTYSVTLTDNVGCTATADGLVLTEPTEILAPYEKVDAVCGGAPGSATITPSGGTGPYTYLWSDNGATTDSRNDLIAGTYDVTITDFNGCTTEISITIDAPSDMVLNMSHLDVACNGSSTGEASVTVTGGSPPYQYQWDDPLLQTDKTAINLPAGLYKVVVTDNQQCVQSNTIDVAEPEELVVDTTIQHIGCFGASTGSITAIATGGTLPYQFTYLLPDNTTVTAQNLTDIPAGAYQLTVEDANGCQVILDIIIIQPEPVILAFANSEIICFGENNGTTQVNVTGGTAPYQYLWSTDATTSEITNLLAGDYTVSVTDAAGCVYSDQTTISEYPEILLTLSQTPALCHDGTTGKAAIQEIIVAGATIPLANYSYSWNTTPSQTTVEANQLIAGQTYEVTATDLVTGCTATQTIEIGNPAALTGNVVQETDVTCKSQADGNAEIVGIGGTPDYTYQWDAGASNQVGSTATNLPKGQFNVTITDANGCTTTIDVNIDEPDAITIAFDVTDVRCSGELTGAIDATVNGGEGPYTFLWSNSQTTEDIVDVEADTYTLSVTDARGCVEDESTDITEPGEPLLATTESKDVTCNGGQDGRLTINPTGGTSPYQYSVNGAPFSSFATKLGLVAGPYNVVIKDSRGCTTDASSEIYQPEPILLDLGPNVVINYGESIQLNPIVLNGIGTIIYQWSTGSNGSLSCFDCPAPYANPENQEYVYLRVIDENGCTADAQKLFNVAKHTKIYVPSGFSPNGDGENDVLYVLGQADVTIESFSVFDRWGEQIFSAKDFDINDATSGWDGSFRGETLPLGQYAWQLRAIMPDGRIELLQGFSTIIR